MTGDGTPYERMLHESLKDELRVMNAHLPGSQRTLYELLAEEYPSVSCKDGTTHLFKKKELSYLAGLVAGEDREKVNLPFIIEISPGNEKMEVICRSGAEVQLLEQVLGMKLREEKGRVLIHAPQLAELRRILKTTTQYLFSPKFEG